MRPWLALLLVSLCTPAWAEDDERWHRAVGLLEYLAGDYPVAVATGSKDELLEQRGLADELVKSLDALGDAGAPYRAEARALKELIDATAAPELVTAKARALTTAMVSTLRLARAPSVAPPMQDAPKQFEASCGSCHGPLGHGDGPAATGMEPPPADFHDAERVEAMTPYKAFNTVSFGIPGTPMVGFPHLATDERWALAFYVQALRHPECRKAPPDVELEELAISTDAALAAKYGAEQVACLRRVLPRPKTNDGIATAKRLVGQAQELYASGDTDGARQRIVDAYLQGFEPLEPALRARAPELVEELERAFMQARLAAQDQVDFAGRAKALEKALLKVQAPPVGGGAFWTIFVAALLILLREGFEAMVVVGALMAVLKKLGATRHLKVVHAGWVSALVTGVLGFVLAERLLAGANREWMETIVALIAVVLLLYAALWLNARATMSAFMTKTRQDLTKALGQGSLAGVFFISFTSVGRESLETVLFLQGLAGDSPAGVIAGALVGLLALGAMVLVVRSVGFKLPMKTLFSVSTALLVATAVMLLGKGVHGLQELDVLPIVPVRFFSLPVLGIFPDALSLGAQLVLGLPPIVWWLYKRWTVTRVSRPLTTPDAVD